MSSPTSSTPPATPYDIQKSDVLFSSNTRYLVTDFSGEGYFGRVGKCVNLMTQEQVAVKIHKDDEGYLIRNELEMLEAIRTLDPDKSNMVTFFEGFRFHNLSCLTFEILDKSLVDVMREQQRTMHLNEIRPITHQLLVAFKALKSIGILHLDLKPDNIMFSNHKDHPFKLKLIDFGLAQRVSDVQAAMIIQPFSYQALEVGLGLPLSEAMDMWGVGCVMAFMYFGANLLPYHCPYDWMRTIVHLLGQPEEHLLNDSCIGKDSLSCYDADCSDDSSIDGDPHTSANVESSADEDFIIQPSSMRCSDSLPPTPLCEEDLSSSNNGHSDGETFSLDMSAGLSAIGSSHDSVSERSILSYQESGAAPTSPQICEVTLGQLPVTITLQLQLTKLMELQPTSPRMMELQLPLSLLCNRRDWNINGKLSYMTRMATTVLRYGGT
ncbi:Homeodomain-interacting protein kinase 3 [Collichthys lucidus]|uniref:Homeodomain-interacting protein kinase 3 n=1 Tax=Collichthys lucidus TaxID=240159 RepID=A0A4V6AMY2_COLLU|nr:Homeodomain-interacting protein kinase 3 [Collichthys lucidus]